MNELKLATRIVYRATQMDIDMIPIGKLTKIINYLVDNKELRGEELLGANDYDFAHDIIGIQKNFNIDTLDYYNFFLPRYATAE